MTEARALRARLEPADSHDSTLAQWEASLPEAERNRWRAKLTTQKAAAAEWQAAYAE